MTCRERDLGAWLLGALSLVGCAATDPSQPSTAEPGETEQVGEAQAALGVTAPARGCMSAVAGGGWRSAFLPQSTEGLTLTFRNYPTGRDTRGNPLIDGVVGLSNGPATRFADMGAIVRFNSSGGIDARDGDRYVGNFPYITGEPFEVQMSVDITSHRYTVYARHADSPAKPFELVASNLAFRTEQGAVTRFDSVNSFVDSETGSLDSCSFLYQAPEQCTVSYQDATTPDSWRSRAFPRRGGNFVLEFDALPATRDGSNTLDAVIGAASGAPTAFAQLGAIVRFRPDGKLDARNGSAYAADVDLPWTNLTSYHVSLDIDAVGGKYSVRIKDAEADPDAPPVVLAQNYAFRSEQASVTAFDHVGQFIDGGQGALYVCSLTIVY